MLDQQGPEVRRFLLETSVLERLTGPLCDAVTGRGGGSALLASLEARNLLIVPLDNRRRWYRYHHLFSDVLQSRLLDERPTDVAELHRRASQWYQQAGEIARGRLHHAHRTVTRALRLAQDHAGQGPVRGSADMWVALSRVTWERGDLVATADHLRRAADLGEVAGLPQQPYRWRVAMAQLRAAEGDAEGAAALLEEADRIYSGVLSPNVRPVAATRARLLAERETSRQPVRGYEREDCPPPMS